MVVNARLLAASLMAGALVLPGAAIGQTTSYPQQNEGPTAPAKPPKPKGGCLKYGAAGAVGGHFAHHHGVLGAMGGCAVGAYVKHRSKKSIAATGQP